MAERNKMTNRAKYYFNRFNFYKLKFTLKRYMTRFFF